MALAPLHQPTRTMPSEAAVNAAAAGAETAAKGAAKGAFWVFNKMWAGLVCACGVFSRQ